MTDMEIQSSDHQPDVDVVEMHTLGWYLWYHLSASMRSENR